MFLFAYLLLQFVSPNTLAQQQHPAVNCPNNFKYSYDPKYGGHHGLITVQRDGSAISEIQVNMSVNTQGHLYSNLQIITLSRTEDFFYRDSILKYVVRFPLQTAIPKLISLMFNGRQLCSGVSDLLVPGIVQTHMWAKSTVTTYGPIQSSQAQTHFGIFSVTSAPIQRPTLSSIDSQHVTSSHQSAISASSFPYQCGTTVGGDQNPIIRQYPWLAAIMHKQNSDYSFQCTGNLISNKHVITAGHCVKNFTRKVKADNDFVIILGKLNMENGAKDGVVRQARAVVTHPNYKHNSANSDIAIIVLNEPIVFKPSIVPVCLWDGSDDLNKIVGKLGTVVGWDKVQTKRSPKEISLPVVPQEQCFISNKILNGAASTGTFCAGTRNVLEEVCADGSGAGFIIKDDSTQRWFLRGLIGYSLREPLSLSCDLTHYIIFTDLAKTRLWIEEEMKKY